MKRYSLISTPVLVAVLAALMPFAGGTLRAAADDEKDAIKKIDDEASTPRGATKVEGDLADRFAKFAGSRDNAISLIHGLRDGSTITLSQDGGRVASTFRPVTGKLGYGETTIALALAQESLAKKGITNPTPAELQTSLNGVLDLRKTGKGWGEIANSMNTKLGTLMRNENAAAKKTENPSTQRKAEIPESVRANSGTPGGAAAGRGRARIL